MHRAFSGNSTRLPPTIGFRPIEATDESFLRALYGTTRAEEMRMVPWSAQHKEAFVAMQFDAQHRYYQEHFPDAEFLIVERDRSPIGRIYLGREPDQLRLIDIALMPEERGQGLGEALLRDLLDEATATGLPVRIHVEQFNPAYRLYRRLGFEPIQDKGVYRLLEWHPVRLAVGTAAKT